MIVTLVGKPGCHLCDAARRVVAPICAQAGVELEELSVLDDPELMDRFGEYIPVVLIDGAQHDFYRVDPARFAQALATAGGS